MTDFMAAFLFGFALASGGILAYGMYQIVGAIVELAFCEILRKFGYEVVDE